MKKLELLSPAKDYDTAIAAILSGADAVYIGAPHHGARASASNKVADIEKLCKYAHIFGVKIYVTLNTIIYEDELESVRKLVIELYNAGVDALIVQDMALLQMDIPPIELHASTQCDIRTPEKARFLQNAGFKQLVLPREMSLDEIRKVRACTDVTLEAFVHGALCVCYSGDCRASFVNGGRSANRGECAQICRLQYDLIDGDENVIIKDKYLLSLKDMNRINRLAQMIDAGITSFKIEGRLKSIDYVRNVTAAYSDALNRIVEYDSENLCRSSFGVALPGFIPDLNKSFNRGFTSYFLTDIKPGENKLGSHLTPGHIGQPVAKVIKSNRDSFEVLPISEMSNGDGVGYFDSVGHFQGMRVNRIEGNILRLYMGNKSSRLPRLEPGTLIYRNFDKQFIDVLASARSERYLRVNAVLDYKTATLMDAESESTGLLTLSLHDEKGITVTVSTETKVVASQKPQTEVRKNTLSRTGNTPFRFIEIKDKIPDNIFVPVSVIVALRRKAIEALQSQSFESDISETAPTSLSSSKSEGTSVTHTNLSNSLSLDFYKNQGQKSLMQAIEVKGPLVAEGVTLMSADSFPVMTTRYCLRRELGACLKTTDGKKFKEPLTLRSTRPGILPMRIEFDCKNCRMKLWTLGK